MFLSEGLTHVLHHEPQEYEARELEVRVCDCAHWIGLGLHIGGDIWGPLQPEHRGEAFRQFADDDAANSVA